MNHIAHLREFRDDYCEVGRMIIDSDTIDGIQTKKQYGQAKYWVKTFGCTPTETRMSIMTAIANGRSPKDVANQMGVTVGRIYQQLQHAMRTVRYHDVFLKQLYHDLSLDNY